MANRRIFIPEMRVSFPHLFQPRKVNETDTKARYSCTFLVPKGHPVLQEIAQAITEITAEAFPNGPPGNLRQPPWVDGDTATNASEHHPGHVVVRSASTTKPYAVDQNVNPIIDPSKFYSGCVCNGAISVYNYKPQPTPGITFGLDGVQFVRDGERLDGRPEADQLFKPVAGAPPATAPTPPGIPGAPGTSAGPAGGNGQGNPPGFL